MSFQLTHETAFEQKIHSPADVPRSPGAYIMIKETFKQVFLSVSRLGKDPFSSRPAGEV